MSYKVLVVPEDFTKDEHILKPMLERVLSDAGRPKAEVQVCRDPNFQGFAGALAQSRLREEVIERYPMIDLFILLVDRDGKPGRDQSTATLERELEPSLKPHQSFLALTARQEVEIFPIAGHSLAKGWNWKIIRTDPDVKDTYFVKLAKREKAIHLPYQGRKQLMSAAMKNWSRIKSRCPEETVGLAAKIKAL